MRPFHALLAHPVYFSINRRSITGAVALGLFVCVFPFIGHTPVVVLAALLLRVNLPVAVLAAWVANPLTYGLIFYGEYLLGTFLLGAPPLEISLGAPWRILLSQLAGAWRPLWLGAVVLAPLLAATGYVLSNAAWRLTTHWRVRRRALRLHQRLQERRP